MTTDTMAQPATLEKIDRTTLSTAGDIDALFDVVDQMRVDVYKMVVFAQELQKMFTQVAPVLSGFMPGLKVPGFDVVVPPGS